MLEPEVLAASDEASAELARFDAEAGILIAPFASILLRTQSASSSGRALIHAMLRRGGLTRNLTVPVSAGLLHKPDEYFAALTAYRDGDVDAIVHAMTNAAFAAVHNERLLAGDVSGKRARWARAIRTRSDSSAHRLLDLLLSQPVITTTIVAQRLGVSTVTAGSATDRLVDAGVLTQTGGGRRYRIWQAPEIISELDAFAERARRGRA